MEAAFASGVLKPAGDKLGQLIFGMFASMMNVTNDLSELRGLFRVITSRLSAVGDRAIEIDPSLTWVQNFKDVASDIEDLLYDAHMEAEKNEAGIDGDNCFCANSKSVIFRFKMASKIMTIKVRFDAIVKQISDVTAIENILAVDRPGRRNINTIGEMSILGNVGDSTIRVRDEEKESIISTLVETNEREKILTVSIVGLGGSGKTTLANHICDDKRIKDHFQDAIYWVHVSEEFDVLKLIGKLFETVSDKKSDLETQQHMVKVISDKLSSKKFLLVLDDAWHENRDDWKKFIRFPNRGAPGSRILLTTRNKRVSEVVESKNTFDLELLQPDDSWKFFQQCSGWTEEAMDPVFIEVGKDIASKCGGVPLAIKTLAAVLYDERDINAWQAIRDSNLLSVQDIQDRVMGSLRLSYFHLRDDLRQCFVLCSIFPKGYMIDKEQLIDLWIAHDMISVADGVHLEYIGSKCFSSLVQMGFLQDVREGFNGRVTCRMHDLVHCLARSILGDEIRHDVPEKIIDPRKSYRYFSLIEQTRNVPPKGLFEKARAMYVTNSDIIFGKPQKNEKYLRSITMERVNTESVLATVLQIKSLRYLHMSGLKCETLPEAISDIWSLQSLHITDSKHLREIPRSIGKLEKLRTLNLSGCASLSCLPDSVCDCCMISTLDLNGCNLIELPDSIGRNKKLRVLRLCYSKIERLPPGITTLENLEHLDLHWCFEITELPEGMGNLKKLEVLNLEGCYKLCGLPAGFGQLTRLQKLRLFVVGEGEKFARISELGNVGKNSEELIIKNIGRVNDPGDASRACLKEKDKIHDLTLDWGSETSDFIGAKEAAVLEGLEPPSQIECLSIHGYPGMLFALWMLRQHGDNERRNLSRPPHFQCLTELRLSDFPRLKDLQGLVELPCLEELKLEKMPALKSISGGPFPSLVKFEIWGMPRLEELWTLADGEEGGRSMDHNHHRSGQAVQVQISSSTCFPRLSYLHLVNCPRLEAKPYLPCSLESVRLQVCTEQLLLSPFRQGQGCWSSNDVGLLPPSYGHLKHLQLQGMTAAESGSGCGWELLQHLTALESLLVVGCHGLTELPESMRSLTSLRSLNIEGCSALRVLPEWLGELRSLQDIDIRYCNSLCSFPPSMQVQHLAGSLQSLEIWDCDALHQLPEWLGELRALRELFLRELPGLTCLPQSMHRLTSLERLTIVVCKGITSLPAEMQDLTALQELSISHCYGITSLPAEIQGLTSLERLCITQCEGITCLPAEIQGLTALKELDLAYLSGLTCLPQSMRRLTSLQRLCISHCEGITSLPAEIQGLTSLERLGIYNCEGITCLPAEIQGLTALKELDLFDLPGLTCLPQSMHRLTSLERLRISQCKGITCLPAEIQGLTSLKELSIIGCEGITSLPAEIQGLTALKELELKSLPGLTCLPQSMSRLTSLERLRIIKCQGITCLPAEIQGLTALKELELWSLPGLTCLPQSMRRLTSLQRLLIIKCQGITSLPAEIQGLASLKEMIIAECPDLERRCERVP